MYNEMTLTADEREFLQMAHKPGFANIVRQIQKTLEDPTDPNTAELLKVEGSDGVERFREKLGVLLHILEKAS